MSFARPVLGLWLLCLSWALVACPEAGKGSLGPQSARQAFEAVQSACRDKNADALWSLAAQGLRDQIDARATELATRLSPSILSKLYPTFKGEPDRFNGKEYLAAMLQSSSEAEDPCWGVKEWKPVADKEDGGGHLFVVSRPDRRTIGFRFTILDSRWRWEWVSQPQSVDEIAKDTQPCVWAGHWRFDLERGSAPDCNIPSVPKRVEVYAVIADDGRPRFLPKGNLPSDALAGPQCELEFDGPASGLPAGAQLKLAFREVGASVEASGQYSVVELKADDATLRCRVDLRVKAFKDPQP